MPKFPVLRTELKEGDCLCNHCTALCCRYFSLPIKAPKKWEDYDTYREFLTLGRTAFFVEDDVWYLVVHGDCQYLTADYRCGIYFERPLICGTYTTDGCEYDNDVVFDKYFEIPEQLTEYAEALLPPRKPPTAEPGRKKKGAADPPAKQHFKMRIETPTNWDDYDNLRWYMTHGPVALTVEKGKRWHLIVFADGRPVASQQDFTRESGVDVKRYFETPEQIWEYAHAILPPREPLERDKPLSVLLPVLN